MCDPGVIYEPYGCMNGMQSTRGCAEARQHMLGGGEPLVELIQNNSLIILLLFFDKNNALTEKKSPSLLRPQGLDRTVRKLRSAVHPGNLSLNRTAHGD